jgi:membrane protein
MASNQYVRTHVPALPRGIAFLPSPQAASAGPQDEMIMRPQAIVRMFGAAGRAWWDDDAPRLGASLAYYTLFAIAPILLVATAIAGMVFGAEAVRGEIVGQLDHLIGREGARAVQNLFEGASQRRAGIFATVFGSITFVVAATGAFLELQAALNTIWHVKSTPGPNLKAFLIDRVRSFGLVVAIGFLLMVSLAVTAALAALMGMRTSWAMYSVATTIAATATATSVLSSGEDAAGTPGGASSARNS